MMMMRERGKAEEGEYYYDYLENAGDQGIDLFGPCLLAP